MLAAITDKILGAAKAIVAAATPIITALVLEILTELANGWKVAAAAGATAATVYLTPNKT